MHHISYLDLSIISLSLVSFLLLPRFFAQRKSTNSNGEYLLMNRGLTLPLFVATLTATWYGGILGVTQIAYENGIYSFVTQGLFWYAAYFLFAIFLVKKIRRHQVLSLPELIGKIFGQKARKLCATLLFMHALPVTYALSIGIVFEFVLNMDFLWAQILGVSIVSIYTALGGFRGVVITDALQFILMFLAVIMVVVTCFIKVGDIAVLKSSLPPHYFSWSSDHRVSSALIWLFIACTSTFIHPVFYQRCLAANSDKTAILGIFIAMGFWLLFDCCTTLGGMYAKVVLPQADSALAYLSLALTILPDGLRGLFLAGVLATILSTLDSFMLVAGTSLSYDLWNLQGKYAHQLAVLFCGVIVICIGTMFRHDFEATWLLLEGAFSTSILTSVLAALCLKGRFSEVNFMVPAIGSLITFFLATFLFRQQVISIEPFYIAHAMGFLLFFAILYTQAHRHPKLANLADG